MTLEEYLKSRQINKIDEKDEKKTLIQTDPNLISNLEIKKREYDNYLELKNDNKKSKKKNKKTKEKDKNEIDLNDKIAFKYNENANMEIDKTAKIVGNEFDYLHKLNNNDNNNNKNNYENGRKGGYQRGNKKNYYKNY